MWVPRNNKVLIPCGGTFLRNNTLKSCFQSPQTFIRRPSENTKYLKYVEYRAVSGVFQNIDPPSPLHPATVSSPRTKGGGYTLAGRWGGRGSIFWKTPDIGLASYSTYNLSTVWGMYFIQYSTVCTELLVRTNGSYSNILYIHIFKAFFSQPFSQRFQVISNHTEHREHTENATFVNIFFWNYFLIICFKCPGSFPSQKMIGIWNEFTSSNAYR